MVHNKKGAAQWIKAIERLSSEYPLDLLLKLKKMVQSVFYYHLKYLKRTINMPWRKKHKSYRHITAKIHLSSFCKIVLFQNIHLWTIRSNPLASSVWETDNIQASKSESVDFYWGGNFTLVQYCIRNPHEKRKFRWCIDGILILEWFKMKFKEFKKRKNSPKRGLRT